MAAPTTETSPLLATAWSALGGDERLLELVEVTGESAGLLPSTLAARPAMLAAVSASTLAAAALDAARRAAPPPRAQVDAEHVAVAAVSERHAREEGVADEPELFAPLSRFWRAADGWVRLHGNYPWHRERALRVLGCEHRPEAIAEAIGAWRAADLEDALAAAGALGYAVRDRDEWLRHPQGRAVAGLPLVEWTAGTGDGRPLGPGRVAQGVRVLDLTRVIAGPVATRTLAAWGAQVLRVDSPRLPELRAGAIDMLSGKRSALLDLAEPAGRARLHELLAEADVVVQGYRPGALARYGLAARDLTERYPRLTVVTLSAWGTAGPWAQRRGFDSLVQCPTGIAVAEGDGRRPGALPAQVLDHATGYLAAAAALLSLAGVQRGEPPRSVWLSLAQTAEWLWRAGVREREPARAVSPDRHLVRLTGADRPVTVVAPPGRLADHVPGWRATTAWGADRPAFLDA
ncbi:MAG TPA: CoA transferase [Micromonosporaceae bacterium]